MVQFNTRANEILLKLVYYGPGLSGKTTNLQALHARCAPTQRAEMFSVNTQEDRTLFFDLLPINLGYVYGNAIHLQIYTVPGQVQYDASRRVVLGGADGVVFVADSSESKMQDNVDSLSNLYHNLNANRLNIKQIPFVLQYNKRDLGDAMALGVMNRRLNFRGVPYFEAVAARGDGVLETFLSITRETVGYTFRKYHLDKKIDNFEAMLDLIETNVRESMKEAVPVQPGPGADATVLKQDNMGADDLAPGKPADAQELLEGALKSNMETARLYTELKQVKEALDRKHGELGQVAAQLERANQDNLKTRRYLEGLVQNLDEALVSCSTDGKILTWNMAAERIFGYTRAEIVGRPMTQLTPDGHLAELDQMVAQVLRGQAVRHVVTTRLRKGGVAFPASVTFAPVRGVDDRVLAYSALIRDLTDQQDLQDRLVRSQRQEAVGRLMPALFHAITNQLTPLVLEAEGLAREAAASALGARADRVAAATGRVETLLRPLQTLLHPQAPRLLPHRLQRVLDEAHALVAPWAERSGVTLVQEVEPGLGEVDLDLDPALMVQALVNLLMHGLQAAAASERKEVRLTACSHEDEVRLAFQDSGPPVPEAGQESLFNPAAATTLEALGLPVADQILRQHGGRLTYQESADGGNLFQVDLPRSLQGSPGVLPPASLVGYRALVVDDEPAILVSVAEAMVGWGMEAETCPGGELATQRLASEAFDLLVCDVRMPGLSGQALHAWVQAHRPGLAQRMLFTTGDAFDEETRAFLESNRLPMLAKPFDLDHLKAALTRLLGSGPAPEQ